MEGVNEMEFEMLVMTAAKVYIRGEKEAFHYATDFVGGHAKVSLSPRSIDSCHLLHQHAILCTVGF